MISTLIDISVKKFSESYSRVYFLEKVPKESLIPKDFPQKNLLKK